MRGSTKNLILLAALALALILGSTWLVAGGGTSTAPKPTEAGGSTLPDFQPREKLPADSAVAFPTDI